MFGSFAAREPAHLQKPVMPSIQYIRQAFSSVTVTHTFVRAERIHRFLTLVHVDPNNIALRQTLFR